MDRTETADLMVRHQNGQEQTDLDEFTVDGRAIFGIPGSLTKTSLQFAESVTYEEWQQAGMVLKFMDEGVHWWLGDWWRFGERQYGDMASQGSKDAVEDITGYTYGTVRNAARVASQFEFARRRANLSFAHHYEVTALEPDEQDQWLEFAETEGLSHKALRAEISKSRYIEAQARVHEASAPEHGLVIEQDAIDFLEGIAPNSVDLLLTDPPYMTDVEDIEEFVDSWVPLAVEAVKDTGRAYICTGAYPEEIYAYLTALRKQRALRLENILVWTYRNTLGPAPTHDYKLNWQAIFYLRGLDAPPLASPQMTEQFSVQDINAPDGRLGDRLHAWQKPDELADRLVRHSTRPGERVIDPFAGTGAFIAAAARLGRPAIGSEIDPEMLQLCAGRGLEVQHAR